MQYTHVNRVVSSVKKPGKRRETKETPSFSLSSYKTPGAPHMLAIGVRTSKVARRERTQGACSSSSSSLLPYLTTPESLRKRSLFEFVLSGGWPSLASLLSFRPRGASPAHNSTANAPTTSLPPLCMQQLDQNCRKNEALLMTTEASKLRAVDPPPRLSSHLPLPAEKKIYTKTRTDTYRLTRS